VTITLYEKTIDFVRTLIAERHLQPGDRLPSEIEIAGMTGVSLMTVRRAMSELVAAGTLHRVQGKGTFLRSARIQTQSTIIGGLRDTLALQGVNLQTQLVSLKKRKASENEAVLLSIPEGTEIWELIRVRHFDGEPALREVATIPSILAPDLDAHFKAGEESLYTILTTQYGLTESVEEQTLIARPAGTSEAKDLGLSPGSFIIEVTGVAMTSSGTPFDSFQMTFVPGRFAFRLHSSLSADPVTL